MPTLRSGKVWQIWRFVIFLSILLPLTRNLTPSLSYHSYVSKSRRRQTFSLFALLELVYYLFSLSELVCTKNVFYPILLFPTFSPQASSPLERSRQTEKFQHPFHPYFFLFSTDRAGPYPQAQLYWAGRTMGWMAGWTRYHKYARVGTYHIHTPEWFVVCMHAQEPILLI